MRSLATTLCSVAAALALAAPAAADGQRPIPPDERYDGSCGHLGSDCTEGEARTPRARSGGPAMKASGRVRVRRSASRRADARKTRSIERPRRAGARG